MISDTSRDLFFKRMKKKCNEPFISFKSSRRDSLNEGELVNYLIVVVGNRDINNIKDII